VDVMQSIAVAAHGYSVLCADWGRPNALSLMGWFVTAVPILSSTRQCFTLVFALPIVLYILQSLFGASHSMRGACTNSAAGRLLPRSFFLFASNVRWILFFAPNTLLQISLAQTACAYSIGIEVHNTFVIHCQSNLTP
jgi:hypothetical protein